MKSLFLLLLILFLAPLHAQHIVTAEQAEIQQLNLKLDAVQEKLTYIKEQYDDTLENVREDNNATLDSISGSNNATLVWVSLIVTLLGGALGILAPYFINKHHEETIKKLNEEYKKNNEALQKQLEESSGKSKTDQEELKQQITEKISKLESAQKVMDATLIQTKQESVDSQRSASEAKRSEERAKAYADEHLHKTVNFIDELLETNEVNDKLWYMRAYNNSKLERYANCIKDCDMAISLNPESYTAFNMRALAKNCLQDYAGALNDALKSLDINPNFEYPWRHLGNAYQGLQRYEEAIESYNKGINRLPNLYKLYENRSATYRKMANQASTSAEQDNYNELAEKDEKIANEKRNNVDAISHNALKGVIG